MIEDMSDRHFGRILVVDDTTANMQLLTNKLTEQGYTVHTASDGEIALELVRSILPDLILLVIRMPGMDGYEVCRRLKADERTRDVPVIFISILEDECDKVKGFQAGGVDYITKPYQPEEILARVRTHLSLRELTENLEQKVIERTEELMIANQRFEQEIAERKRAEEVQQRESAMLRCIIDSASDLIYIKDRDGVYLRCNKASEKFVGLSESEQIGKTDFDFFDREKAEVIQKLDRQVLAEGKPLRTEEWVTDRDGRRMLFDSLKAPYYGPNGEVMGLVGISRDVTERKRAEEGLRESAARLKMAMDLARLAQWEYDIESGMFTFDDQFYALYGTTAEREGGTLMSAEDYTRKFIPGEESAVVAEGAAEVLANSSFQLEHRIIRADGEERSIVVCGEAVRDEAGRIVKARGTNQDVTERKRAEEALAKSEARFRRLAENARDAIYRMALPDGAYEYMSPAATELFGYAPEEFYASSQLVRKIIHPEWHVYFEEEWRKLLQGEMPPRYEYQIIHKSGEVRWMNQRNILVRDDEGRIVAIEGIVTDITERKKAEEQIRHLKNYLSNIIDSMPSILVGMDRDEIVTQWNRQAEEISGISVTEAVGRPITDLLPDFSPWVKGMLSEIEQQRPASMEKLLIERKGERRFYDVMLYPIIANGAEGAVVRIEDATERTRIQELMIQTEKMMSVGGLAAGMAHEINNPLGIITQAAQNIERRVSPELPANRKAAEELGVSLEEINAYFEKRQIPEFIGSIRTAGLRAAKIVANMLEFSRSSGTTMQPVSPAAIMEQALELAASDYDLKKKFDFRSIELIRDYAPDMPEVPMVAVEMEQVMLNLLKNAAQAMILNPPDRRPRITLRLRWEERYTLIEVEDNGPGMGEEVRRRVFEPFFTTKEPGMGTGLGLSVSYMIVTQIHKGLMEVESNPDRGACFRVRLPHSKESIHG